MESFDAVVVGGGPAGVAFAITLATAGGAVAVLDRSAAPGPRSIDVLPPGVRPVLQELGVWDRFRSDAHLPSPGILSVWGQQEPVSQDFIWSPFGDGWLVDRRRFADMLINAAEVAGATVHRATRASRVTDDPHRGHGWHVEATTVKVPADGPARWLGADFLVEATGRGGSLARLPAARKTVYDRLVGVVTTVEPACADGWLDHRMLLEATENGWWYATPAPGQGLLVAWMTDPDLMDKPAGRLRDLWRRELDRTCHIRPRVPAAAVAHASVVAANSCYRRAAHGRWLAVGDVAAAYDPLSGQGVIRALRMGQSAAAAVIATQRGATGALDSYADKVAEDFGHYLQLRRDYYRAERRWSNSPFWQRRQADTASPT